MSSSRLVRGAKTRMFAIVCLICVLGAVVFVFHGTQNKLAEVQKLVNSCNQQQESLSAQLQVIFEYKVRLEKSLTKEKEDHKQTREVCENKLREEKLEKSRLSEESQLKYNALLQQNKLLQEQLDQLKENSKAEVDKLSDDYKALKNTLEQLRKDHDEEIQQKERELAELKTGLSRKDDDPRNSNLENENLQLKDEVSRMKKVIDQCEDSKKSVKDAPKAEAPNTNVGEMPKFENLGQKSTNGSTTPGLNPDALINFDMSSPKPIKDNEPPVARKPGDQMPLPNKKPTQESVIPLAQPQQQMGPDQIPVPAGRHEPQGKDHDPSGNTLQKPNTGNAAQPEDSGPSFVGPAGGEPDVQENRVIPPVPFDEDAFQKQGELPRVKNGENYPHGDYEREQPEDEEDDEGEQLDYDERAKKEQKNVVQPPMKNPEAPIHDTGVMVNPK